MNNNAVNGIQSLLGPYYIIFQIPGQHKGDVLETNHLTNLSGSQGFPARSAVIMSLSLSTLDRTWGVRLERNYP